MTATPDDADTLLLKCPSDMGIRNTDRKCTLQAPDKLLDGTELPKNVHVDECFPDEFSLQKSQANIDARVNELLQYNKPIVSIGGDHSISFPLLNQFKQVYPDLKVCWIDAHLDLKKVRIKQGIPHDAVVRALCKKRFNLGDFCFLGARERDPDEAAFLEDQNTATIGINELRNAFKDGLKHSVQQKLGAGRSTPLYLSVDVDVLDQSAAPGTTFPSSDGLQPDELEQLLHLLGDFNIVGADLVELAPPLDENRKTIKHARSVLQQLLDIL
jgi:agmatinase